MKTWGLITSFLVLVAMASAQPKVKSFQSGIVVSVHRQEGNGISYRKITDAPPRSTVFTADISIQMDDSILVGRYQSAIDYMPSTWAEGKSVEVSIDKHRMYLKGASGEEFELSMVSRRPLHKEK